MKFVFLSDAWVGLVKSVLKIIVRGLKNLLGFCTKTVFFTNSYVFDHPENIYQIKKKYIFIPFSVPVKTPSWLAVSGRKDGRFTSEIFLQKFVLLLKCSQNPGPFA